MIAKKAKLNFMKDFIKNLRAVLLLFILITFALLVGLVMQEKRSQRELLAVAGENKAALKERYGQSAGSILTADGFAVAQSVDGERVYPDAPYSDPYVHIVGDYTHNITNTIESKYEALLLGTERGLIEQVLLDLSGKGLYGSDVHLTLNNRISQIVAEQLRAMGYRSCAVLENWKTGEVLAAVSYPAPSYPNLIHYENLEDTSLYNRVLSAAYAPGSTFKMFTSAAWLDSPNFDPNYTVECHGRSLIPNGPGNYGGLSHGQINLDAAFSESCNVFFGSLGVKVGKEAMLKSLDAEGFREPITLDRLNVRRQEASIEVDDPGTLAWFSIGQPIAHSVLNITPLTHCTYAGAVANGGVRMLPHIVSKVTNPLGRIVESAEIREERRVFSPETAADLQTLMRHAADSNGLSFDGFPLGLKTGTAEVDGQQGNTSLLNTFVLDENHPYAMTMVTENSPGSYFMIPYAQNIYRALLYS